MRNLASRVGVFARHMLVVIAIAGASVPAAFAQSGPWTERPYNPPVGSKWSIVSVSQAEELRPPNDNRNQQVRTVSELTIEEKLADGFRVSFVTRDMQITGNTPGAAIGAAAFGAIKGIVVRARTDASGKPVSVDNLEEVKATLKTVIDRVVESAKTNPQVGAVIRQMLEGILVADDKAAVQALMEDPIALSAGQNTGLKPGAVKRRADDVPSPLGGGPLKSTLVTQLTKWDDKAGTARVTRVREMDAEALKAVVVEIARKLSTAASDKVTPEMIEMMKKVSMEITSTTHYDTRDGMTMSIEDNSTTTASVAGITFRKVEKKLVSVTLMPK
ncbi:MAG TPA: hypothetical protein VGM57_07125 [Pseudolabrys sp.]